MTIKEDEAFRILRKHFRKIWEGVYSAHQRYREYPDLTIHRVATMATITNDLIFDRMVAAFDEVPGAVPMEDRPKNLRFISLEDRVLLWFKKINSQRMVSLNLLTDNAKDVLNGQGQFDFMPEAAIIVVGYMLNAEQTAVQKLSFNPPFRVKPEWFIDVEAVGNVIEMKNPRPSPGVRLRVLRGLRQSEFFE